MNTVDGEEAKTGKRAGNYAACKENISYTRPFPKNQITYQLNQRRM